MMCLVSMLITSCGNGSANSSTSSKTLAVTSTPIEIVKTHPVITKIVDEMTDKVYYDFIDSENTFMTPTVPDDEGHSIFFFPQITSGKKLKCIIAQVESMGCVEGGFMIIKFVDGSKLKINNWNDFDCKGVFYFDIVTKMSTELSTKPIDKIMIEDGRDFSSITCQMKNPNFFIELYTAMNEYKE